MDAARNTRSTVKKLSFPGTENTNFLPVTGKVDIEKGSLQAFESRLKLPTSKPPHPPSILEFACIHSFSFLSFPFFLFSRLEKKSLAPLSPLSSLSSNAFKTASPYERCSLERTIFDGGREARFLCEKLSVRSLLPKGTLFFTGLVSLIYPVILEPCGTIRTFVRLPELVHPLDENKKRNKVLACSSFTATYYKQGAAEIFREIFPRLFPYRESLAKQRLWSSGNEPWKNSSNRSSSRRILLPAFPRLVELYYFILETFVFRLKGNKILYSLCFATRDELVELILFTFYLVDIFTIYYYYRI